ncbi:hypothetical protein [Larkinella terrae]|uniref:Uncharacterized protein n=1 Tax=Larkinella terrae TaxID=2025311 RepID=A0A7K0ENV4_9BACT|nr:hypothetical protein [Larkinella terrae]MRS63485.1 hypothetical protein [Larkinella terrae]
MKAAKEQANSLSLSSSIFPGECQRILKNCSKFFFLIPDYQLDTERKAQGISFQGKEFGLATTRGRAVKME